MNTNQKQIQECAYYLWQGEGRPIGRADQHWQLACCKIGGESSTDPAEPFNPDENVHEPLDPIAPQEPLQPISPQQPVHPNNPAKPSEPSAKSKSARRAKSEVELALAVPNLDARVRGQFIAAGNTKKSKATARSESTTVDL